MEAAHLLACFALGAQVVRRFWHPTGFQGTVVAVVDLWNVAIIPMRIASKRHPTFFLLDTFFLSQLITGLL